MSGIDLDWIYMFRLIFHNFVLQVLISFIIHLAWLWLLNKNFQLLQVLSHFRYIHLFLINSFSLSNILWIFVLAWLQLILYYCILCILHSQLKVINFPYIKTCISAFFPEGIFFDILTSLIGIYTIENNLIDFLVFCLFRLLQYFISLFIKLSSSLLSSPFVFFLIKR